MTVKGLPERCVYSFAVCMLLLLALAARPSHAATEDFEDWPTTGSSLPTAPWATYTNAAGWVLSDGKVLSTFRWLPPHGGDYAGWLPDRDVSTNAAVTSPALHNGIGEISYWHASHTYGAPPLNVFRVDLSTNGHTWSTVAVATNSSTTWARQTHAVGVFASAYVRFIKTGDTGNDQHLGFDDIAITEPPGVVVATLAHSPATPPIGERTPLASARGLVRPRKTWKLGVHSRSCLEAPTSR